MLLKDHLRLFDNAFWYYEMHRREDLKLALDQKRDEIIKIDPKVSELVSYATKWVQYKGYGKRMMRYLIFKTL